MVEYQHDTFKAIADPTRRAILTRLTTGPVRVTQLAEPFSMSLNAVSKHIKILEGAGLVERRVTGREHFLEIRPEPLEEIYDWVSHYRRFWDTRLDALEQFLAEQADLSAASQNDGAPSEKARSDKTIEEDEDQ